MVIFFVVVFGFFTFFVAGGVTFTVKEHLPAFRPFTTFVFETEQTFFEAALTVVTIFDFATTLVPSVFKAEVTETVLPFFTVTTFAATAPGVVAPGVPPTPGVPAPLPEDVVVVRNDALNAPPPVPADNFEAVANLRTLSERTPAAVTLSVAVLGISKSRTAPVFLPVDELFNSFTESAAGVIAAVGVVAVPAFVSAALTPRAVKLVSTDLMSPLPEAIVMVTSPEVPSACNATAVGALFPPC